MNLMLARACAPAGFPLPRDGSPPAIFLYSIEGQIQMVTFGGSEGRQQAAAELAKQHCSANMYDQQICSEITPGLLAFAKQAMGVS